MITKAFVLGSALAAGLAVPLAAAPVRTEAPERADHTRHPHVKRGTPPCKEHDSEAREMSGKRGKPHGDSREAGEERSDD
ncbi:hypothetical protein [Novosphingobium sp.]|uniref:hypothetical protein n=1 Tax=Novosphingobium sp. TaxID=1874826 RepID=UPI00261DABAE|nr:hypothetical protein [Novosphingobium sp.]